MTDLSNIPAVILCGGLGTRFAEETVVRPKPMVEIGNRPILWHIMSRYALFGVRRFVLCLGYKGDTIRDYFLHYWRINRDIEINLKSGQAQILDNGQGPEDWDVVLAETGHLSQTGLRIRKVLDKLDSPTFFATYGDGVSTVDISALYDAHRDNGRLATITGVRPSSRFGELDIEGGQIKTFQEKPQSQGGWINGGFMVLETAAFDHLGPDDDVSLEVGVLEVLADRGSLSVYRHGGFWQCMDTARERDLLNDMCKEGTPPWLRLARE